MLALGSGEPLQWFMRISEIEGIKNLEQSFPGLQRLRQSWVADPFNRFSSALPGAEAPAIFNWAQEEVGCGCLRCAPALPTCL